MLVININVQICCTNARVHSPFWVLTSLRCLQAIVMFPCLQLSGQAAHTSTCPCCCCLLHYVIVPDPSPIKPIHYFMILVPIAVHRILVIVSGELQKIFFFMLLPSFPFRVWKPQEEWSSSSLGTCSAQRWCPEDLFSPWFDYSSPPSPPSFTKALFSAVRSKLSCSVYGIFCESHLLNQAGGLAINAVPEAGSSCICPNVARFIGCCKDSLFSPDLVGKGEATKKGQ